MARKGLSFETRYNLKVRELRNTVECYILQRMPAMAAFWAQHLARFIFTFEPSLTGNARRYVKETKERIYAKR